VENQTEVRIEVFAKSVTDVYFWQNGQRSETVYLSGSEDEITIGGNPITESLCAWARFVIQRKESRKNKVVWEVMYKSNVIDNDTHVLLEGVKRKIETAIKKSVQARIDLKNDLKVLGWEAVF
jgi:hypothetical protein